MSAKPRRSAAARSTTSRASAAPAVHAGAAPSARASVPRPAPRVVVGRGNAVSHVYETLRREILSLKLSPGEDLDEAALCERMGLSRTPIREALSRLAGDGLVLQSPNRGVQVAPVNLMELPHYTEALALLQRAVLRAAALRRTPDDLQRIEQTHAAFFEVARAGDAIELTLANRAFHVAIADASHNRYLGEAYTRLLDQGMRLLSVPFAYDPDSDYDLSEHTHRVDAEHREMVEVIRNRDAARAEQLGAEHAELFRSRFLAYLEQNLLDQMPVEPAPSRPARSAAPAKGLRRAQ